MTTLSLLAGLLGALSGGHFLHPKKSDSFTISAHGKPIFGIPRARQ